MKFVLSILFSFLVFSGFSQRITRADYNSMRQKEDTLKRLAYNIMEGRNPYDCMVADSQFTRLLVRTLKTKNSFYYPFDSLQSISHLTAPDSSFKIFTWQLVLEQDNVHQHGAIQMRTADGSLKLFPLIDRSDITDDMTDTVANNLGWMGAVYYKIVETEDFGKKFYTLLGYDENNMRSNKKIIEILTFPNGEPLFGGPYFSYQDNSIRKKFPNRYILEYKKHAGPRLTYDDNEHMIIYEHLISETNEPSKKYTYIPDGDYEGLKWMQGKWVHINKVFTFKLEDGQAPVPSPLKADHGTIGDNMMVDESNETDAGADAAPKKKVVTKTKKTKTKNP